MGSPLPLSMLLSQALVAFTIEFDNEFEHRMPHHTTARPQDRTGRLWLTSQVMWENVLRHVEPDGVPVRLLHERSRTTSDSLAGLRRWGYVEVDPWTGTAGGGRPSGESVVRPTTTTDGVPVTSGPPKSVRSTWDHCVGLAPRDLVAPGSRT